MRRVILINCKPGGQVSLETQGFGGESCREASRPFEEALGVVQSDENTDDYFNPQVNQHGSISH